MKILGEMCALSLIYSYVAVSRFVQYVVSLLLASFCYFLITQLLFFLNIVFMFVSYVFDFVYSVFLYCFVYCFSFCTSLQTTATGCHTNCSIQISYRITSKNAAKYEGWNFNNGNCLFTTDTK